MHSITFLIMIIINALLPKLNILRDLDDDDDDDFYIFCIDFIILFLFKLYIMYL